MKNGEMVGAFERAFADYVGGKYAIALCNGTATLHTALAVLRPYSKSGPVYVPPLTMSSTSLAVLHAGGTPQWIDVDPDTWLMQQPPPGITIPVALYGLNPILEWPQSVIIMDAAQTLAPHQQSSHFTSYSFQASKILALGEGGMLVTNDEELATSAREFASLGYRMAARQPRINPETLKYPRAIRHHGLGWNYRMSDLVASEGICELANIDKAVLGRAMNAAAYREVVRGCTWLTPQVVPATWMHDWWTFAVALEHAELWEVFADSMVRYGGEQPYAAWRLAYDEPVFGGLEALSCPVAESLQPRLVQFQTNDLDSAERNAEALVKVIRDLDG